MLASLHVLFSHKAGHWMNILCDADTEAVLRTSHVTPASTCTFRFPPLSSIQFQCRHNFQFLQKVTSSEVQSAQYKKILPKKVFLNYFFFSWLPIFCVKLSVDAVALHLLIANSYQRGERLFIHIPTCNYEILKSDDYKWSTLTG